MLIFLHVNEYGCDHRMRVVVLQLKIFISEEEIEHL